MKTDFVKNMAQKIIAERGIRIEFLVLEGEDGKENFFYLLLKESEYQRMKNKVDKGENVTPEEYGLVIYQGEGNKPSPELDKKIMSIVENIS